MNICLNDRVFKLISELAAEKKLEVYVIGGFVRDCLLGKKSKDIDIVVLGDSIEFATKFAERTGNKTVNVFKNFGTAMIRYKNLEIEFVGARKESYRQNSRKPLVQSGTLEDDQFRRDFTINAMALNLNKEKFGELIDPFQGIQDLKSGVIRTPLDPDTTFSDDPLRMLRAIRFASRFNFVIEENTYQAIKRNKDRISIVSNERIREELNQIILTQKPSKGFIILESTGLLELILPEVQLLKGVESINGQKHKDNFYHTLQVMDNVALKSENLWLRWAALLHDIAKAQTKKYEEGIGWTFHGHDYIGSKMIPGIFKRLKLPLDDRMKYVKKLVMLHLRPISLVEEQVSDSAVRRLLFEAGNDIDDLMLLCEADITSKNEVKVKQYLRNFQNVRKKMKIIEEKDHIRNFQPPISGNMICGAFGIPPSKEVGIIKNAIKNAILDGEIPNKFEPAWEIMLKKGFELGLKFVNKHSGLEGDDH